MNAQDSEAPRPSLAGRLVAAARRRLAARPARETAPQGGGWGLAAALAALVAAGPLATIAGAHLIASGARAESRRIEAAAAARIAAAAEAARTRAELAALVRRPTLGATLEALARALPADAGLARVARNRQGLLEADVATPDPDRLRAALRREPGLAGLRDAGQRQGEGAIVVTLREAAP